MIELRPYQIELIQNIRKSIMSGHRSPCGVLGCGGGKSIIQGTIAKSATDKENRVLFLVHRKELCEQITGTFNMVGVDMSLCSVSMVQTVSRRLNSIPKPDLIITDECFTSDTVIDGKPLTELRRGDIIASYNSTDSKLEYKEISYIFKRKPSSLLTVRFSDGTFLKCTKNHPIYIEGHGYVPAVELKEGYYARRILLHDVWKADSERELRKEKMEGQNGYFQKNRKNLLFFGLLKGVSFKKLKHSNGEDEQKVCKRENEEEQPDEKPRNKKESFKSAKGNRPLPEDKMWKRNWSYSSAAVTSDCTKRVESVCRVCNPNKIRRKIRNCISRLLQSRHCDTSVNACNRGGWKKPLCDCKARARQEENFLFELVRVESVEVHERTGDGTFGGLCPDGYVYNLEVKDNHNYFANGILVHNCHHSIANTYKKIYDYFPNALKIGFTATPMRLNKGGLGEVYDDLIESVSTQWLIQNHYLAPYHYYSVKLADTSKLHTKAGEFDSNEVSALMENEEIYGDTVRQWERLAKGKKTIVYCASVESASKTASEFCKSGYLAVSLSGNSPKEYRQNIMQRFRSSDPHDSLTILCNCELFGEGLSVDGCECVVLLRPTQSLTLFIQQSMRSMRYLPGKTAIIIDHVGNCYRHGLPDDDRKWSLEPKKVQENTVKIRECQNCYACYPPTLSKCPYCGAEATHEIQRKDKKIVDVDLVEVKRQDEIRNTKLRDAEFHSWDEIVEFQKLHHYKFPWCFRAAQSAGIPIPKKYSYMRRHIRK